MPLELRKDEIFQIAKNIIVSDGSSSLTIRRLAKEANISVGSVYNIFGTKDDLLLLLIKDYWSTALEQIIKESKNNENTITKLELLYKGFKKATEVFHTDWLHDLMSASMTNPKILEISTYYKKEIEKTIQEILNEDSHVRENSLSSEALADFIFENMIILLKKQAKELGFFKLVLEKIIN